MDRSQNLLMGNVSPSTYKRYKVIIECKHLCLKWEKLQDDPCDYEIYKDLMIMYNSADSLSRKMFMRIKFPKH